jgi:PII-like signaling protein
MGAETLGTSGVFNSELKGKARLMRMYMGESDKWQGEPLFEAILKRLRLIDLAGATVYRGILGYEAKGHTPKSGWLPFSHDLPIMISVVDTEEKLTGAMIEIESMMKDGIIVLSDVDVIRLVRQPPGHGVYKCEQLNEQSCSGFIFARVINTAVSLCMKRL